MNVENLKTKTAYKTSRFSQRLVPSSKFARLFVSLGANFAIILLWNPATSPVTA
jgi:hypothetical protein